MEFAQKASGRASVPPPGWTRSPAPTFAAPERAREKRVPVSGARSLIVVLTAVSSALAGALGIAVLYELAQAVAHQPSGFRAGAVITLTAVGALAIWLPIWTWHAGNWLARVGITIACPACSLEVAIGKRSCVCGQQLRPARDRSLRLPSRCAGEWPVRYAPLGFVAIVAIWLASGGLFTGLGVHVSPLLGIGFVDLTLVGVALALANRVERPQPWQFGLRETSLSLASKTALAAYACMTAATAAYYLLFGPFTAQNASFVGTGEPAGILIAVVVLAPAAEEFFFRGFIYGTLRRRLSWHGAAFVTTAMFVSVHWLSRYPVWALAPIAFFSIASCLVYERTGSIWPCIALHAANNASVFASPLVAALTLCAIVVATVAVIQRSGSDDAASPHWIVPVLAGGVCAAVLAMAGAFKISEQSASAQLAAAADSYLKPEGFPNGGATTPMRGMWTATGAVTSSVGYGDLPAGQPLQSPWQIDRSCSAGGSCVYLITRQTDNDFLTARLVRQSDGWHASFPPEAMPCGMPGGTEVVGQLRSAFVFRFSDDGMVADANESMVSFAPHCGYATATEHWHATIQ